MSDFNENAFRIKFRACLAVLAFIATMIFLIIAVTNPAAAESKYTGTIIGFMTGTLITLVFTFYFGSSESNSIELPKQSVETGKD